MKPTRTRVGTFLLSLGFAGAMGGITLGCSSQARDPLLATGGRSGGMGGGAGDCSAADSCGTGPGGRGVGGWIHGDGGNRGVGGGVGGSDAGTGNDALFCCPPDPTVTGCMHLGGASEGGGCYLTCDFWCSSNWRIENDPHGCPAWHYDFDPCQPPFFDASADHGPGDAGRD